MRRTGRCALIATLLVASHGVWAQPAEPRRVFTCIDATGKRLTSDRAIPECVAREQRVLNSDGSLHHIVPPTLTAEEHADAEARERDAMAERVARQDAIRRDRNLMARFPDEAAHRRAREAALDDVRNAVRISEARVKLLTAERKPLLDEAEFYPNKPLPAKLKSQLDATEAALAAQRNLVQNQETEVVRINALYDAELARLRKLWGGAPAGSIRAASTPRSPQATTASATKPDPD